jgi:hypothetical protein
MAESNDLQAALDEYGSSASPYSALNQYLMQQPVYDRGPREAPAAPTLRTLEAITPDTEDMLASQYERIMEEQRASDEAATAARQAEIDSLRDLLRQELSTSEDAALAQRSDITKALEGRIADMQREVDAETLDLRQAGLDERAALARQIEEGDRLVRQAQEAAIGDLSDRQGSLVSDLTERIGSLSTDLTDINSVIESNFQDLLDRQQLSASELSAIQAAAQTATDQELATLGQQAQSTQGEIGSISQQLEALGGTQAEINSLNQQLESLYTDVESGNAAQSETIRNETANLIAGLEQQIGGLADNLGALPIESIQSQLAAVNDQTAQFQQAVDAATGQRAELASRIDALQAAGLTQDDLAAAINPISQQRQEAISAAVNPIQAQIEALRGEIPQQVDTEALRQQITDDIMAQMQSQQPPPATTAPPATTTPPITVGSAEGQQGVSVEPEMDAYGFGPSASEAAGFNPYGGGSAAAMNVSDGRADAMGLFEEREQFDPRGQRAATPTTRIKQPAPTAVKSGGRYYTDPVTGNSMYQPPMPKAPPRMMIPQVMPTPIDLTTGKPRDMGFFDSKPPSKPAPTIKPSFPIPKVAFDPSKLRFRF